MALTSPKRQLDLVHQAIDFIDLKTQMHHIRDRLDKATQKVFNHGQFIMGPEVHALEDALADFAGVKHALGCSNGTDAISLVLMALEVGPGDAILVPSFTFAATAEVVALRGATPVFIDSKLDDFNIDTTCLEKGLKAAEKQGLKPKAVISVDLFGLPADYTELQQFCQKHKLWLIDDAAQSYGAKYQNQRIGGFGIATTTSFFPAKPLGCYGDGGAIFTNDDDLAKTIKSLRVHGQGDDRYDNVRIGINGRLDTLQAAILLEKLAIFPEEIEWRNQIAARYNEGLKDIAIVPPMGNDKWSTWAQYTLRLPIPEARSSIMASLKEKGVPSVIYYPKPLHQQTAYKNFVVQEDGAPVCEQLSREVLSLPMHPYLDESTQDYIIEQVRTALAR